MLPNFSSQQKKAEFLNIRQEIDKHMDVQTQQSASTEHSEQLERRIFNFIDVELGTKRSPSEARIYKKLIKQLNRTRLLNEHYIKALEKKVNKYMDKKTMKKEKNKIKT